MIPSSTDFSISCTCKVKQKNEGTNTGPTWVSKFYLAGNKNWSKNYLVLPLFCKEDPIYGNNHYHHLRTERSILCQWRSYIKTSEVGSYVLQDTPGPQVQRETWANSQEMKAEVPAGWPAAGTQFLQVPGSKPEHLPHSSSPFLL